MADLDTLAKDNAAGIRKFTRAVIFVAPESAEPVTTLTEAGTGEGALPTLKALPEGFVPVGLIKKDDGIEFSAERDTSEVESLGYAAPTRRDILKEDSSLKFTPHETNRLVTALYHGLNLDNVVPDENGEVSYAKPTTPPAIYYRVLIVGRDGVGSREFYKAWFVPRGMITETESTAMSAEDEASYGMTLAATPDSVLGYSVKEFQAGSGFKADAAKLGWTASA